MVTVSADNMTGVTFMITQVIYSINALTVSGITVHDKTYDGTDSAVIDMSNAVLN